MSVFEESLRIKELESERDFWKAEYERLLTQYNQKWGEEQAQNAHDRLNAWKDLSPV